MDDYKEELIEIGNLLHKSFACKGALMKYTGGDSFCARFNDPINTNPYEERRVLYKMRKNTRKIIPFYIKEHFIPKRNRDIIDYFISGKCEIIHNQNIVMFFEESFYDFLKNTKFNNPRNVGFRIFYAKVKQYKLSHFDLINFKRFKREELFLKIYQLFKNVHLSLDNRSEVEKWKYNMILSNNISCFKQVKNFDIIKFRLEYLLEEIFN